MHRYYIDGTMHDVLTTEEEYALATMSSPVRCTHCGKIYDMAAVTVEARYTDCSVWKCPHCRATVDDRGETGWTARRDYERIIRAS